MTSIVEVIKTALGEEKADLVIRDAEVIDVNTKTTFIASIAVKGDRIARVGDVEDLIGEATVVVDGRGLYAAPGFFDAHMHVESTHLTLTSFAEAALSHGTTSVVIDPHEIANVLGLEGVDTIVEEAKKLPLTVYVMMPSCVPAASPDLETSGAILGSKEVGDKLLTPEIAGLAEVMNFPGVLACDDEVLKKVELARALKKPVDGHAPLLRGTELDAYLSACILSDHETVSGEEALEKLRKGMYVAAREGTASKNLEAILRAVKEAGIDTRHVMLATDDLSPIDLVYEGHVDVLIRKAVELGFDPVEAIQMATINTATYLHVDWDIGSIAPGKIADIVLIDDLEKVVVRKVVAKGMVVAEDGRLVIQLPAYEYPKRAYRTMNVKKVPEENDLAVRVGLKEGVVKARVIGVLDKSLLTQSLTKELEVRDGVVCANPDEDVLYAAVVERHQATGNVGRGFASGFGIPKGALASSIAHDAHNVVGVGASLKDLATAIAQVVEMGGGIAVSVNGKVVAAVELPIAGLMTPEDPLTTAEQFLKLSEVVESLGSPLTDPLMTLSFMSLCVIPELKLTDKGLVDVSAMKIVDVVVEGG